MLPVVTSTAVSYTHLDVYKRQEGVLDYTSLTLNGKAQSVVLTDEQVPIVKTVVISIAP